MYALANTARGSIHGVVMSAKTGIHLYSVTRARCYAKKGLQRQNEQALFCVRFELEPL